MAVVKPGIPGGNGLFTAAIADFVSKCFESDKDMRKQGKYRKTKENAKNMRNCKEEKI